MQNIWNFLTLRKREATLPDSEDETETSLPKDEKKEDQKENHYMRVDSLKKTSQTSRV